MTTIELKKVLIHRISEINDISYLKAIKTILDSKTETEKLEKYYMKTIRQTGMGGGNS